MTKAEKLWIRFEQYLASEDEDPSAGNYVGQLEEHTKVGVFGGIHVFLGVYTEMGGADAVPMIYLYKETSDGWFSIELNDEEPELFAALTDVPEDDHLTEGGYQRWSQANALALVPLLE